MDFNTNNGTFFFKFSKNTTADTEEEIGSMENKHNGGHLLLCT